MTISKRFLLASLLIVGLSGSVAQAISLVGYDMKLLVPLKEESMQVVEGVNNQMEATRSAYASGKKYLQAVYNNQKAQLKLVCDRLKNDYKVTRSKGDATWYIKKQTYKAYKKFIYENWKKTRLFPEL